METDELARMFLWVLGPGSLALGIFLWGTGEYKEAIYRGVMGVMMLGAATYGALI